MRVFSYTRFFADEDIGIMDPVKAMINGWPQQCDMRPVEELEPTYKILDKWTEEVDPRMAKRP